MRHLLICNAVCNKRKKCKTQCQEIYQVLERNLYIPKILELLEVFEGSIINM